MIEVSKKLVIANWKMHGRLKTIPNMFEDLLRHIDASSNVDIAVCVPYPYLFQAQAILQGSHIAWGAQNVSRYEEGAYTASVSANMISDFGCQYALIGHSERRAVTKETNSSAAKRIEYTLKANIAPIYCIGETTEERQAGIAKNVVSNQLRAILDLDPEVFNIAKSVGAVIAYEPVWAIGSNRSATPEEAQEMHQYIRAIIASHDKDFATSIRLIYGGSVTSENAKYLFDMPDIDGGLVGRSALNPKEFANICNIYRKPALATK